MDPLSHPYMTTGKTITLMVWTFVGKVMSLLFNTLSGFLKANYGPVSVLLTGTGHTDADKPDRSLVSWNFILVSVSGGY